MSTEVRQEIKIVPAQVKLARHVRHVYSCRRCEHEEISVPVVAAPAPSPVIPGSLASPSAVAHIMNSKYVDGLPLYRQEQQFSRLGAALSRRQFSLRARSARPSSTAKASGANLRHSSWTAAWN